MSRHELIQFADNVSLARAVAERWLELLSKHPAGAPFCVALSGGRIPKLFYAEIVRLAAARPQLFANVHFFWGDERCVPPTDAESNFALANENLFKPLGIASAQVHRVRGELPPDEAIAEAARKITRIAPLNVEGQPVLDLVFLGMGEDGHIASLFPGESEEVMASRAVYRAVTAAKPPPRRITLGYAALVAAKEVWVMASGVGKENALAESLSGNGRTPLARLLQLRSATRIFSDVKLA